MSLLWCYGNMLSSILGGTVRKFKSDMRRKRDTCNPMDCISAW